MSRRCLLVPALTFARAGIVFHTTTVPVVCLTVLGLVVGVPAARAQGPATLRALSEYRLTMPTLRKVITAGRSIPRGPEADAIAEATNRPAMSIEDVMAVFDRYPSAKRAVASSGLSSREFATAYLAFYYTSRYLAEEQMRRGMGQTPPGPPAHVRPDNVALLRQNEAELRRLSGETG